jgi:hypothetical protein
VIWEKLGWKMKEGPHKRPTFGNLRLLIEECGMKIIKHDYKLLVPVEIPFLTGFANKNLEKYFRKLAFIEYLIAVKS